MSSTEDETRPRCSICVLRGIEGAVWDRDVEDKKGILLAYIHQHGILAPMMPEHFHRIRMMKLDLEQAQIARARVFDEADQLDEVENYEEMIENFRSWARFMKTVGTDKGPHFNRILITYINVKIAEMEGKIDSLSESIAWYKKISEMTVDELRQSISDDLLRSPHLLDIINSIENI